MAEPANSAASRVRRVRVRRCGCGRQDATRHGEKQTEMLHRGSELLAKTFYTSWVVVEILLISTPSNLSFSARQ